MAEEGQNQVFKVGVRIPPFYPEKPSLWFCQLESQFVLAGITTDLTKYHYAVGQLDAIYAAEVEDVISSTDTTNKYERFKTALIKRLSASREKKLQQLLNQEELGNRKPSQFLRHLKQLAGSEVPDDLMRTIWMGRLPAGTQTILASQSKSSLDDVADLADSIHDVVTPSLQVAAATAAAVVPGGSTSSGSSEISELAQQIQELSYKVERLSRPYGRDQSPHLRRNRSSSRGSSMRSQSNYRRFPLCWYHAKYAAKATRCIKPCDWKENDQGGR